MNKLMEIVYNILEIVYIEFSYCTISVHEGLNGVLKMKGHTGLRVSMFVQMNIYYGENICQKNILCGECRIKTFVFASFLLTKSTTDY